jgi:hypothetical protein
MALSPFQNTAGGYINTQPGNVTVTGGGSGYILGQVSMTGIPAPTWTTNTTLNVPQSGRMELRGTDADLVINGVSLNDTLKLIQDRLNMLRPNRELEAEWDQLKELGDQYRKLEKQLIEKQKAWDLLRKKEG